MAYGASQTSLQQQFNGNVDGNIFQQLLSFIASVGIQPKVAVAKPITATLTAAEMASGLITSTSAAAVALTTPTATALLAAIALNTPSTAVAGCIFPFIIDNSAGASTITLTLDASIAVATPAITGGATLTVSAANKWALFVLYFDSATTAKIARVI